MKLLFWQIVIVVTCGLIGYECGCYWAEEFHQPVHINQDNPRRLRTALATQSLNFQGPGTHAMSSRRREEAALPVKEPTIATTTEAKSVEDLYAWVRRDPIAAANWYILSGWQSLGGDGTVAKARLAKLFSIIEETRSEESYSRRLSWTSFPGKSFSLIDEWKVDNGKRLAERIEADPQGNDLMWTVADGNPASGYPETAEWVASLRTEETERASLLEQLARRSVLSGEGRIAAQVLAGYSDPVFDRARSLLATKLILTDPQFAKSSWDSLTSPGAKLVAVAQILTDARSDTATRSIVTQWAEQSGIKSMAGSGWNYLVMPR